MEGRIGKEKIILQEMQFENDYDEFMKEKKDIREQSGYTFSPEY